MYLTIDFFVQLYNFWKKIHNFSETSFFLEAFSKIIEEFNKIDRNNFSSSFDIHRVIPLVSFFYSKLNDLDLDMAIECIDFSLLNNQIKLLSFHRHQKKTSVHVYIYAHKHQRAHVITPAPSFTSSYYASKPLQKSTFAFWLSSFKYYH